MIRVLYLIDTLEVGGAEKSLLQLLPRFRDIQAMMCNTYVGRTLRAAYEREGIPVVSLDLDQKYGFGRAAREVGRVLRSCAEHTRLAYVSRLLRELLGSAPPGRRY